MHEKKMHKQTLATGIEIDVQLNGRPCSKFQQIMNLEFPNELRQFFQHGTLSWYIRIVDANKGNYKPPTMSTNKEFGIPY